MIRRTVSKMDAAGWPWIVAFLLLAGLSDPLVEWLVMGVLP